MERDEHTAVLATLLIISCVLAVRFGAVSQPLGYLRGILALGTPLLPVVLGAGIVISIGEIDLSVAGLYSISGTLLLYGSSLQIPPVWLYITVVGVAVFVGLCNGVVTAYTDVSSVVFTLAVSFFLFGSALFLDHRLLQGASVVTRALPQRYILPVDWMVSSTTGLAVLGISWYVAHQTRWGLEHRAIGLDEVSASYTGIDTAGKKVAAFAASSVLTVVGAMLHLHGIQNGGWTPRTGAGFELVAIVTALIGGVRIAGGVFSPAGIGVATLLWESLEQLGRVLPFVGPETQQIAAGILLISIALATRASQPKQF